MARVDGHTCDWVAGFHPKKLPYRVHGGILNGLYNLGQKFAFDDGTIWFLLAVLL
jgi:hypothetical protein